jgi:chemotaxis protein MotB
MVTVLMCLFIVLFAMSSVDTQKYEKLKNSLATGFGVTEEGKVDTAEGIVLPPGTPEGEEGSLTNMDLALKEVDHLTELKNQMQGKLNAAGLAQNVEFQIGERGLTVKLVGSQTFFMPDRPELTERASQVLTTIAPVLSTSEMEMMIEGHAANGITSYPSTWELSSARSVNVLRYLVDRGHVRPGTIGAVAFGSARQVNDDSTEALMELNRRVDVVVLSDQPEVVRALIPEALKARAGT